MKQTASVKHILALAPNWLGDAAMATPALRALHHRFPEAEIRVAGRPAVCALLDDLPWIHQCVSLPARPSLAVLLSNARALKPHACDLCVVFPHSFRAALLARLTGARQRLGYNRGGRRWLLTDTVEPVRGEDGRIQPVYMAREYLDLLAPLGCADDDAGLELFAPTHHKEAVLQRLDPGKPVVGLAPGAAFGPSKRWPPEGFAAVADVLAEKRNAQCVLITGPGEEMTRDAVRRAAKTDLLDLQCTTPSLARLKAIIASLDLLVGNDSGPRHVAIAFNVPVLCLMGSTSPVYTDSPWERGRVLRKDVDCGPCQKPECTTDHRCMTRITAEEAAQAALEILDATSR
jgi:heptosyltransferase II